MCYIPIVLAFGTLVALLCRWRWRWSGGDTIIAMGVLILVIGVALRPAWNGWEAARIRHDNPDDAMYTEKLIFNLDYSRAVSRWGDDACFARAGRIEFARSWFRWEMTDFDIFDCAIR
jgi:hypothetical protein